MRTIIDLPERQVKALGELCAKRKISRAEAIRRAVAIMLEEERVDGRERAFGTWRKKRNSRKWVERLRKEWS